MKYRNNSRLAKAGLFVAFASVGHLAAPVEAAALNTAATAAVAQGATPDQKVEAAKLAIRFALEQNATEAAKQLLADEKGQNALATSAEDKQAEAVINAKDSKFNALCTSTSQKVVSAAAVVFGCATVVLTLLCSGLLG